VKNILNTLFVLFVAFTAVGCNLSASPLPGTDSGVVYMGDAGPVPTTDAPPVFRPPVCEGIDDHVTRIRVRVDNGALLGSCAGTWSAFALLDGRTVGSLGSTLDQNVPDADMDGVYDWNGYLQLGFQCSSDGRWKTDYVAGTTASAMGVSVTVWYGTREVNMSHSRVYNDRLTVGMHESCTVL
jgi:hypothetical protein